MGIQALVHWAILRQFRKSVKIIFRKIPPTSRYNLNLKKFLIKDEIKIYRYSFYSGNNFQIFYAPARSIYSPLFSVFLSVLEKYWVQGRLGILQLIYTKICKICFTQAFLSIFNVNRDKILKIYTKSHKFTQALLARLSIIPCLS